MKRRYTQPLIALATTATLLLSSGVQAKIVCWTNNEGIRECGNAVPPEYAQKESRTLNEQGRTTEVKERAKTQEEIAAEKARLAEEKRLEQEAEQKQAEQDAYDQMLLSTYLKESDILRSRDRQSTSIDATIEITNVTVGKLQEKLDSERKKAAGYERRGKKLPDSLVKDIESLESQIDDKKSFINRKELEKKALHEKYEADRVRFLELKAERVQPR